MKDIVQELRGGRFNLSGKFIFEEPEKAMLCLSHMLISRAEEVVIEGLPNHDILPFNAIRYYAHSSWFDSLKVNEEAAWYDIIFSEEEGITYCYVERRQHENIREIRNR
ncbi:hypothetical protein LCGC14_3014250 [marine sediment metagenome]|uniref:Uncharacterized protein n=1 Tax=marine sediment metagenome TaxID=412755 RepID=A0A0F8ZND0_9ZZZZ